MRILHVCDSINPAGIGGYESYLHYLSLEFRKREHDTEIVTQASSRSLPLSEPQGPSEIHHLRGNLLEARKWEFLAHPAEKRDSLVDEYFNQNDLEENIEKLAAELWQLIDKKQPHLIHCHSTYVVFNHVLTQIAAQYGNDLPPVILTVHGLPKPLILPSGEETTDYEMLFRALPFDLILAVSDTVKTALKKQARKRGAILPIKRQYLGINLDVFNPQKTEEKWDLAYMGRLEDMKSVHLFPDVLSKLKAIRGVLRFVMTGEGSQKQFLFDEFKKRKLGNTVDHLGIIPAKEIPNILNLSRVFLYPSKREPFGLSIVEAMACKTPVVTSNRYGPREIITAGVDGIMVDSADTDAIVRAVNLLLEDAELREKIGQCARNTVEKRFDIQHHVDSLLETYHSVLRSAE
ncbi:glycosyltransferase family 1 protein [Candidatus Thorarchaeota archaeon]|nr:MAG: glycosyltransferase family 1 protein [Candidatus Thorarchaeota archaeon]